MSLDPVAAAACSGAVECWLTSPDNALLVRLLATLAIILLAGMVLKLVDFLLTRTAHRYAALRNLDSYRTRALVGRTRPMQLTTGIVVFVAAALSILAVWGLRTAFTGLLAGAGFLGIVVGLAARDTLGDMIAGFRIFFNHPFEIGDWVEIGTLQGYVEDVRLGSTVLLTFDNEKVTLPNRLVDGSPVRNFTHARQLRRRLTVGVEYGSDLALAQRLLQDVARANPNLLPQPEPQAVATRFGDSAIDLELRYWVEPTRRVAVQAHSDLIQAIHDTFHRHGLAFAFPHVQLVQGRAGPPPAVDVET